MRNIILFILLTVFFEANSQTVSNVKAELQGEKVLITYDLKSDGVYNTYNVLIYCSFDKYITPLKFVTGDVASNVRPGNGKIIIWDYIKENLANMDNIDFKVIATGIKENIPINNNSSAILNNEKIESKNLEIKFRKNSVTAEILANASVASINYERVFYKGNAIHMSGQIGFGAGFNNYTIPLAINVYYGKQKSFFLTRVGFNHYSESGDENTTYIEENILTFLVGYKYQKKIILKVLAGAMYSINDTENYITPWGGISIGYAF